MDKLFNIFVNTNINQVLRAFYIGFIYQINIAFVNSNSGSKVDNNIYFYLNDILQFSYISHLPLSGSHIGFLARDDQFEIHHFIGYTGSQNVTVNCLAVPDAFLSHKDYQKNGPKSTKIGHRGGNICKIVKYLPACQRLCF